ncbi:MAG: Glutaminase, partial [Phycisphaerales bacterium]|nr:Glutaminase [Phycisphaerales bacterium]
MSLKRSHRTPTRSVRANPIDCESLEGRRLFAGIRAPAVPLITSDPYLSIWSQGSKLTDVTTTHWTGAANALVSLIRIDGTSYRLMGTDPSTLAAFPQTGVQVLPTRSIYDFDNGHIHVTMTFMQPALGTDLTALSLPLSYINWDVRSVDGLNHSVQVYDSVSSQLAVNTQDQQVVWQRGSTNGLTTLRVGTPTQTIFNPAGDGVRIDWGYAYLAAYASQTTSSIGGNTAE